VGKLSVLGVQVTFRINTDQIAEVSGIGSQRWKAVLIGSLVERIQSRFARDNTTTETITVGIMVGLKRFL
jgi:hypothetical protein